MSTGLICANMTCSHSILQGPPQSKVQSSLWLVCSSVISYRIRVHMTTGAFSGDGQEAGWGRGIEGNLESEERARKGT